MSYIPYNPDQDVLLPASLREELGEGHLAVFVHCLVERLDVREMGRPTGAVGRPSYPPQMLLKIWLYAYARGITSSRRIEQCVREDLGFRFLAGQLKPDHWTLNEFRKRHPKGLNDVFTRVLEAARELGFAQLGKVAIDSTRVKANASGDRTQSGERLRRERAKLRQRIRRWQKQCDQDDQEGGSTQLAAGEVEQWQQRLQEIPRQLKELRKSGQKRSSSTDPESRYLRRRGGFVLGYTAELAVSEDHWIVAQRVHRATHDAASLAEMAELVEQQCGSQPKTVLADRGYYSMPQIQAVEQRGIEVLVPDQLTAIALASGVEAADMNARQRLRHPGLQERRERFRDPEVKACYARRKQIIEPVFGVLKQQRSLREFRTRGLNRVSGEWALAATAFNLTRLFRLRAGSAVPSP
jgi:transposase